MPSRDILHRAARRVGLDYQTGPRDLHSGMLDMQMTDATVMQLWVAAPGLVGMRLVLGGHDVQKLDELGGYESAENADASVDALAGLIGHAYEQAISR
jgi:hypothetical protein